MAARASAMGISQIGGASIDSNCSSIFLVFGSSGILGRLLVTALSWDGSAAGPERARSGLHDSIRYTRRAVPENSSDFSSSLASCTMRLNAFHKTTYEHDARSTGKFDSNM